MPKVAHGARLGLPPVRPPPQGVQADQRKVLVGCWWCGVVLDEWEGGDDLLGQHLLHSRETGRPREGSCRWALYLRDQQRWESGTRVRAAREPSTKEVTRDFSISSRRRAQRLAPSSEDDGMAVLVEAAVGPEATSSPSGAVAKPPPKKKAKVPPPPPPKPAASSAVRSEEESPSTSRSSRGERALSKLDSYAVNSPV